MTTIRAEAEKLVLDGSIHVATNSLRYLAADARSDQIEKTIQRHAIVPTVNHKEQFGTV